MDYQEEYLRLNPNMHLEDSLAKVKQVLNVIPKGVTFKSMLDVACGAGLITMEVAKELKIQKSVGIDISNKMIEKAKEIDKDNLVQWEVADIFKYKLSSEFDLVLCVDILEHLEDDLGFLEKVSEIGKYAIVKTPLERSLFSRFLVRLRIFDPWEDTKERYGHLQHYDEKSLTSLIAESGFTIEESISVPMPKRSKRVWEFFRLLFYPIVLISMDEMVRTSGGFKILLLESKR